MKSKFLAYLLWFLGGFGILGLQHFYLGKVLRGIIWFFTGGVFGIGALIDLFTLSGAVDKYNLEEELKITKATVAGQQSANQ